MRLRLIVSRHNLPDTRVLWNVDTSSSPTIYQLLEQVNEIIPIQTTDWGLEDYTVESNGFDCIHYRGVSELFKEDEEVLIKPLSSRDLKVRRISGRHQISSEGFHLYDGVPFGKPAPLSKRPLNRPEITIPPRKRARLTLTREEEEEEDGEIFGARREVEEDSADGNKQLVLHADFDDEDSEDDEDFAPAADEGEEDEEDAPADDDSDVKIIEDEEATQNQSEQDETGDAEENNNEEALEGFNESARAQIRKLHSAFPSTTLVVCRHVYEQAQEDAVISWEALDKGFKAVKPKSAFTETVQKGASMASPNSKKRSAEDFEDEDMEDEDDSQEPFLNYYDQNGLPPGSISSGRALSIMAEAVEGSPNRRPTSKGSMTNNKSIKFADDEELSKGLTSTPLVDQEIHLDESEDASSSNSSDEAEVEDESTSSSGSDNDSDSSSEDESTSEMFSKVINGVGSQSGNVEDGDSSSSESENDSDSTSDSSSEDESPEEVSSKFVAAVSALTKASQSNKTVGSEKGKKKTQFRNARRRNINQLQRYMNKGILPAGTSLTEFKRLNLDDETSAEDALLALQEVRSALIIADSDRSAGQALAKTDEFERRRQILLASLASGGVEVGTSSREPSTSPVIEAQESNAGQLSREASKEPTFDLDEPTTISTAPEVALQKSSAESTQKPTNMESEDTRPSTAPDSTDTPSELSQTHPASVAPSQVKASRRPKLDIGAGARLLFGALGRRAPKNKDDAEKLKQDMMKGIKPLKAVNPAEEQVADASESEEDEAWKDKITYRAVECCYDGVELSEPPFPFEQRWDPQQNGKGLKRMRSHGRNQFNDAKRQKKKAKQIGAELMDTQSNYESSFQEDSQMMGAQDEEEGDVDQQLMNDLQPASAEVSQVPDDLVALPEDPSSLPQLEDGKSKVGMTIAFKKLDLSADTNWQPQISLYRTAIVVNIEDNGDLDLRLAVRDRAQKSYDDQTGERTFAKFEMPVDDDEDGEDDGRLYLSFSELVEPKVVAPPPANTDEDSVMDEASQAKEGPSADESVTLSHEREEEPAEAEFSHVTETTIHSDVPEVPEPTEDTVTEQVEQSIEIPVTEDVDPAPKTPSNGNNLDDISSENVKTIKGIMKDAGFRSSVPTVVLDNLGPNSTESPGDAAVFEKLFKDMTDIGSRSYSPKFNGFGSSPLREPQERSKSSEESQDLPTLGSSPPKRAERTKTPEVRQLSQRVQSDSPEPPQSSWQTVDSQEPSSPAKPYENTSSWVTIPEEASSPQPEPEVEASPEPEEEDPTPQPTPKKASIPRKVVEKTPTPRQTPQKVSSPQAEPQKAATLAPGPAKVKSIKKKPRRTFGRAQDLWDNFEARKSPVAGTPMESPNPFSYDGTNENDRSVVYPELIVGSSFTSQVTDHGRQPDFNFDDSTTTSVETPKVPSLDVDEGPSTDAEPGLPTHQSNEDSLVIDQPDDSVFVEPELPARKPTIIPEVETNVSDDDSSDDLPPPGSLFSQRSVKEKTPLGAGKDRLAEADKSYEKAMAGLSEESDNETTPKASRKQRQVSHNRQSLGRPSQGTSQMVSQSQPAPRQPSNSFVPFKSRSASQPSGSQRSVSQRASHARDSSQPFIQPGTQVIDLCDSSDAGPDSPVRVQKRPKQSKPDSDSDDDVQGGWVLKRENAIKGVETRRHTSVGLRDSSQTSLNQNRRKTSAK